MNDESRVLDAAVTAGIRVARHRIRRRAAWAALMSAASAVGALTSDRPTPWWFGTSACLLAAWFYLVAANASDAVLRPEVRRQLEAELTLRRERLRRTIG